MSFTRICKLLIRPTSYVKFVLIRFASNWCSVQLRPYSCLIGYPGIETSVPRMRRQGGARAQPPAAPIPKTRMTSQSRWTSHTILKFSGRWQPGCFWATFGTPSHLIFHQKHHFYATISPLECSGDDSQAARILGKKYCMYLHPEAILWHKNDVFDEK